MLPLFSNSNFAFFFRFLQTIFSFILNSEDSFRTESVPWQWKLEQEDYFSNEQQVRLLEYIFRMYDPGGGRWNKKIIRHAHLVYSAVEQAAGIRAGVCSKRGLFRTEFAQWRWNVELKHFLRITPGIRCHRQRKLEPKIRLFFEVRVSSIPNVIRGPLAGEVRQFI